MAIGRDISDTATLVSLLQKGDRRRKSSERKAYKLRGEIRRMIDDHFKSLSSRHRTIEEQWEIMRELQRCGLVSREDMEQVIKDVTRAPLPKMPEKD